MVNNISIFISCVTDEFGKYRDALRKDLTEHNLSTKIQEDFIAYGGATLEKLDDYIQHCEAVIHIAGDMTGSMANKLSLQYITKRYPDFGDRIPELQSVLKGETDMSYTQWEAWLAVYHGKQLFIATPSKKAKRSIRYKKDVTQMELQQAHLNYLKAVGHYAEIQFTTIDELVKKLYQSQLGDILNAVPKIKPVNLPYKTIGTGFKGREPFMHELQEMFSNSKKEGTAIALSGLGGIGKTRLAVEFAWQHVNNYTALLFVTASSPELLKNNIANLCDLLMPDFSGYEIKQEDVKYAAVINWLNQFSRWLLIIDNVDTPEAAKEVEGVLPHLWQGHVLITTRTDKWSQQVKTKRVDILDKKDAAAFLLETTANERQKTKKDVELADSIANDLGCLALALEQARAYIVTEELSFENYRKNWEKSRKEVLSWFDEQQMQYSASVAITWQTSFNQLSDMATILLNRLAWLAVEPIPKTLLEVELPESDKIDTQSAWKELKQYSLATSTDDKKAFTIHKLVQEVTLAKMDEVLKSKSLSEALNWINTAFTGDPANVSAWPNLEPLIPHVLSVTEHAQIKKIYAPTNRLINQVAIMFLTKAQYAAAEPLMRTVLENDEQTFGPNHPEVARYLNNLAQLLKVTNRLKEAEPLMKRALDIDEQNFGPNHPDVAIDLNNLGLLLKATNRLKEAEPLLRRALDIDEQNFGANHPNVARDLNNLAQLLQATNRWKEAQPLMKRVLKIDEQSFGSNHPEVAKDLNNLAQLLNATNRWKEAEPLLRRALEIDEQSFGPNHPDVAIDLNNLAQLLTSTNRLKEAEPLMRRALDIDQQCFGPNHPKVARDLINLAQLFKDTNRLEEAEPLIRRALDIDEQSFGPDHPDVAIDLNNLSQLLKQTNRLEEAEPLMRRALEITEQSFGSNHPDFALVLNNLAQILQSTNRLEEAEPLMRRALEITEQSFGSNHTKVAIRLNNLATLLQVTNRLQESEPLLKRSLIIFFESLGKTHPNTDTVLTNYILTLTKIGLSEEEIRNYYFGDIFERIMHRSIKLVRERSFEIVRDSNEPDLVPSFDCPLA